MENEPYTPEELAALEATAERATPGKRTAVYLGDEATGVPITQPEMLDYVRRTIDISGGNAFHLVHVEAPNGGDPLDLCHTGNGRDSEANSQHIATFDRETCLRLIHQLRQQTARAEAAERERLDCAQAQARLVAQSIDDIVARDNAREERDAARTWGARACAAMLRERAWLVSRMDVAPGARAVYMSVWDETCAVEKAMPDWAKQSDAWADSFAGNVPHPLYDLQQEVDAARTALAAMRDENYTDLLDQMQEAWGNAREVGREELTAFLESRRVHKPTTKLRTALAAAAVERARLVAALKRIRTWAHPKIAEDIDRLLTASPHADLAAVRAAVTALQSYADGHVDCTSCARQALAVLPSWCREQP